ncbi:hypothetical protein H4J58_02825 [Colwellia sp. MB3u-70]|uniref:hypothetical protein n=1 Tax=unclassified Colwellia TaxID=196834 RepID=UPI0015F7044E|nr:MULTISPECIES: hypothetical protein [unclassified Colwellia]MBA6293536.1 hypothetical protein [Colwellia sp. MB3u-8]MBA6306064.1 hypothetical protein [Colwellia sp. MB3u-70]
MALKADLRHFLDEEGKLLALTEQAKTVFKFLSKIVSSVSERISKRIEQPIVDIDLVAVNLKCNTRAEQINCEGDIEAKCINLSLIEWHCDSCEAAGTISHWQGSLWDKQQHTIH